MLSAFCCCCLVGFCFLNFISPSSHSELQYHNCACPRFCPGMREHRRSPVGNLFPVPCPGGQPRGGGRGAAGRCSTAASAAAVLNVHRHTDTRTERHRHGQLALPGPGAGSRAVRGAEHAHGQTDTRPRSVSLGPGAVRGAEHTHTDTQTDTDTRTDTDRYTDRHRQTHVPSPCRSGPALSAVLMLRRSPARCGRCSAPGGTARAGPAAQSARTPFSPLGAGNGARSPSPTLPSPPASCRPRGREAQPGCLPWLQPAMRLAAKSPRSPCLSLSPQQPQRLEIKSRAGPTVNISLFSISLSSIPPLPLLSRCPRWCPTFTWAGGARRGGVGGSVPQLDGRQGQEAADLRGSPSSMDREPCPHQRWPSAPTSAAFNSPPRRGEREGAERAGRV